MRRAWSALFVVLQVVTSASAQQDIPRMTAFPQVVAGGPWSTDFIITNQGLTTIQGIELSLFKDIGAPLVVATPDLGKASVFKLSLQPGETAIIRATGEPEPNDNQNSAQTLTAPVVVSGAIDAKTDVDCFRITGRQGDIVSAMAETVSLDTPSELVILASDGKEIAWNDQNGTDGMSRNDAFIRMALPADGTYFIRITDCKGNGGSSFRYKLHGKVQAT